MRGFGFESTKRRQLFILTHNETFSVVAMRVSNEDRSTVGTTTDRNRARSQLLFLAQFLESGIGAQRVPKRIEP